ncbi:MAG: hypothetical protein SVX43_14420 [Cyanobacteriota bacterium]|nr:hypothetical protein [Cyanobacteriota bacterium]
MQKFPNLERLKSDWGETRSRVFLGENCDRAALFLLIFITKCSFQSWPIQ